MYGLLFLSPLTLPSSTSLDHRCPTPLCKRVIPRLTSAPSSPPNVSPPTSSPFPLHILSTPLLKALFTSFRNRNCTPSLTDFCSSDVVWDTPLFTLSSPDELTDLLNSFLSFAIDPTIYIPPPTASIDCINSFAWTVSFNWPLPWRPRVAISGETELTFEKEKVTKISDDWNVNLGNLIKQTLPTLTDLAWLWPTPHAESDVGMRRLIEKRDGYQVMKTMPRDQLRVKYKLQDVETKYVWMAPVLPDDVFTGSLRKQELYSVVTPTAVSHLGDRMYEFAVNIPGLLVGSTDVGVPECGGDAEVVHVPELTVAVVRVRKTLTEKVVRETVETVSAQLERDGWSILKWWARSFDARVGFNEKGYLAIASFGKTAYAPAFGEIVVEIERKSTPTCDHL